MEIFCVRFLPNEEIQSYFRDNITLTCVIINIKFGLLLNNQFAMLDLQIFHLFNYFLF